MSDPTQAPLADHNADDRGLFDDLKESASSVLDLFSGVSQADVAAGHVDLDSLSRADRIELLIDGKTSSVFGSSPWSVGLTMDQSVALEIHAHRGGTLVFAITSNLIDVAESKVRPVRYALVWDDSIISETAVVSLSVIGQTFLIVALKDEPLGKTLTLWLTDDDLSVQLVQQGTKQDVDKIRNDVIGKIGAAAGDQNPVTDALNKIGGFITASQVGGLVALAVVGVVLVVVVRSEAFKDVARVAAKAV